MSELIERLRAAREQWINAGDAEWRVRRPTLHQFATLRKDSNALLKQALVGWKLRELDLIPGGNPEVPPFDSEVALEWLQDRPEAYTAVLDAIFQSVVSFVEAKDAAAGKS